MILNNPVKLSEPVLIIDWILFRSLTLLGQKKSKERKFWLFFISCWYPKLPLMSIWTLLEVIEISHFLPCFASFEPRCGCCLNPGPLESFQLLNFSRCRPNIALVCNLCYAYKIWNTYIPISQFLCQKNSWLVLWRHILNVQWPLLLCKLSMIEKFQRY